MPRCTAPVSQWGGQHLSGGGETAPPKVELTSRAWRESRGGDHSRASGSASGPVLQTDTRPVCSSLTCAAAGWPRAVVATGRNLLTFARRFPVLGTPVLDKTCHFSGN